MLDLSEAAFCPHRLSFFRLRTHDINHSASDMERMVKCRVYEFAGLSQLHHTESLLLQGTVSRSNSCMSRKFLVTVMEYGCKIAPFDITDLDINYNAIVLPVNPLHIFEFLDYGTRQNPKSFCKLFDLTSNHLYDLPFPNDWGWNPPVCEERILVGGRGVHIFYIQGFPRCVNL